MSQKITNQNLSDLYITDPRKACQLALRRTVNIPEEDRLEAIDKMLGTCGTEALRGDWQNGHWCDIVAAYCNPGDTYALTVIQVRPDHSGNRSKFIISSWGDFVERNERKYNFA